MTEQVKIKLPTRFENTVMGHAMTLDESKSRDGWLVFEIDGHEYYMPLMQAYDLSKIIEPYVRSPLPKVDPDDTF